MRYLIEPFILTATGKLQYEIIEIMDDGHTVRLGIATTFERAKQVIHANEVLDDLRREQDVYGIPL